jgi:hypothetical protein
LYVVEVVGGFLIKLQRPPPLSDDYIFIQCLHRPDDLKQSGTSGIQKDFSDGDTASPMVFSVLLISAMTNLVVIGFNLRSMHSTEA